MSQEYKYITLEEIDRTALITINRSEVYNALNKLSKLELVKAIRAANKNDNVNSIVITATGKAFCTGQDLNDRSIQASEGPIDLGDTLETEWNPLVKSIRESEKIVTISVNGVAAGAGLSVVMAADFILAAPKVKFISGFTKLGLTPDAGLSYAFTKALGYHQAMNFFMFNEPLTSEILLQRGVISKIIKNPKEDALEFNQRINLLSKKSNWTVKRNLQYAQESTFNKSLEKEVHSQRYLGKSPEYQEGLNAFFEKRNPNFNLQ